MVLVLLQVNQYLLSALKTACRRKAGDSIGLLGKSSDTSENVANLRQAIEERDEQAANLPAGRRHPLERRRGRLSAVEGTHQGAAGYTVCGR